MNCLNRINNNCIEKEKECEHLEDYYLCPDVELIGYSKGDCNLLSETKEILKEMNLTFDDVETIYFEGKELTTAEYVTLAEKINYDDGYGGANFEDIILIIDENIWIEREEYDGSEWFVARTNPIIRGTNPKYGHRMKIYSLESKIKGMDYGTLVANYSNKEAAMKDKTTLEKKAKKEGRNISFEVCENVILSEPIFKEEKE